MKKIVSILLSLISVICVTFSLVGCGDNQPSKGAEPPNEYEEKSVAKIVTEISFGEVLVYYDPVRTFDFISGTVTDTVTMDENQIRFLVERYSEYPSIYPDYESAEEYESYLRTYYNSTEQVANFTEEQSKAFLEEIISLGIYDWDERYDNNSFTCGTTYCVTIIFTDGTQKRTAFYDCYPENYKDIENAFKVYLGAGIYCTK